MRNTGPFSQLLAFNFTYAINTYDNSPAIMTVLTRTKMQQDSSCAAPFSIFADSTCAEINGNKSD